jgi:hypothetical protein
MYSEYVITSGNKGRAIATRTAASAREAALDYVFSLGCRRDEITSYGSAAVAWRGAIYRAELASSAPAMPKKPRAA